MKQVHFRVMGKNRETGEMEALVTVPCKDVAERVMNEIAYREEYKYKYFEIIEVKGYECDCCGDLIEKEEDMVYTRDDYVCRWCYEDYYYTCYSCDEVCHADDMHYSERIGGSICQDCYEEYYTSCYHCGDIVHRDDVTFIEYAMRDVCDDCFHEHYSICDHCGEIYPYHEVDWNDEECSYLCQGCMPTGIRPYSYKPDPTFHKLPDEEKPLYLGIELEIDKGGRYNNNARIILDVANGYDEEHIYIKSDASVPDGFEIISQPCSYEYHMKRFPWYYILKQARDLGYLSHDTNTCGLHIHIDRNYFGETREEQSRNIRKLVLLVELFSSEMKKIGRRGSVTYCKYVTDEYAPRSAEDLYIRTMGTRYHAVNLQNTNTVELRFFRGTLNMGTLKATIQFVKFLVDFAINESLEKIEDNMLWLDVLSAIDESKYPLLVQYLKTRGVWFKEEGNEQSA